MAEAQVRKGQGRSRHVADVEKRAAKEPRRRHRPSHATPQARLAYGLAAAIACVLGYAAAYAIAAMPRRHQPLLLNGAGRLFIVSACGIA